MRRSHGALLLGSLALVACAGLLGIRNAAQRPFEHRAHSMAGIACTQCHEGMSRAGDTGPLHVPGPAKCISCHAKPHDARACDGCHGVTTVSVAFVAVPCGIMSRPCVYRCASSNDSTWLEVRSRLIPMMSFVAATIALKWLFTASHVCPVCG